MDPNAPPKEYPKPKDPEHTLVRRASVSLKRAGSILSRTSSNTNNSPHAKNSQNTQGTIAEGNENEHSVTLEDTGSVGTNLVRKASTSFRNAATALNRVRRSGGESKPAVETKVDNGLSHTWVAKDGSMIIHANEVLGCGGVVVPAPPKDPRY